LGSEVVAYMSVNTQGTTSKIGYLLQYTGYLNSAIGFNREYSFKNSKERLGEENLSKLKFTGDNLKTVISNSFKLDTTTQSSNTKLDTIHTDLDGLTFDASSNLNVNIAAGSLTVDSVKIKASNGDNLTATGTSLNANITNFPTDTAKEAKQDIQIQELEKIVNKTGDIIAEIPYSQGSSVWTTTTPIPTENPNNSNGWLYTNTNTGNSMNLDYFNGNNETKTLSQVVGQYAVVSNLSAVLNNSLIFVVLTKGSPFFTTSETHSPAVGVNMAAGAKYLLYWGAVPDDIYPNLPRLNFTSVMTNGPAIGTEEILSVALYTDSGATAGSVNILIENLGVVFSNGTNNQSRVYNLITNNKIMNFYLIET
jgi:hypothetical protein